MDKKALADLQEISKALKAAIVRSQNGIAALSNIAKLGAPALAASAPNIFTELRQLETDMQKFLKNYKDQLNKTATAVPTIAEKELDQ